jgi:uncharacterized protein YbjQ (UPF0145 family)
MPVMSGLSGNEMYCLRLKGLEPGELVIGNSVYSTGFLGSIGAGLRTIAGGEVTQVTQVIHDGRLQAYKRMTAESDAHGGHGITGVTSDLKNFHGNVEFLSIGACVHKADSARGELNFSTSSDGQELYCQLDAGFTPIKFVFGNVAYSIGVGGGIIGGLKSLGRGEIKQFSDVFNHTRHLALQRMVDEAKEVGANSVVGIQTTVMPFRGIHEMMMTGTASRHLDLPREFDANPVTSDLTCEEMWNMVNIGYLPIKLVLGTAVYSLGFVGGMAAFFKSFSRGEINELTSLIYDAREHAIGLIRDEASSIGADDVIGIKTHVHELGGLLEFMAIGTAVRRFEGLQSVSPTLPCQAIIRDKDTWISHEQGLFPTMKSGKQTD